MAVAKDGAGQFWITVEGTGKPFVRESFATAGFCLEVALEIEKTFEVEQVIELRPPETMERIGEMVQAGQERERVAECWGDVFTSTVLDTRQIRGLINNNPITSIGLSLIKGFVSRLEQYLCIIYIWTGDCTCNTKAHSYQ